MENFIFIDDEWSYMLIENVDYKEFRKSFDSLTEKVNDLWEDFNFFYTELQRILSKKTNKNVKINWIECFKY